MARTGGSKRHPPWSQPAPGVTLRAAATGGLPRSRAQTRVRIVRARAGSLRIYGTRLDAALDDNVDRALFFHETGYRVIARSQTNDAEPRMTERHGPVVPNPATIPHIWKLPLIRPRVLIPEFIQQ